MEKAGVLWLVAGVNRLIEEHREARGSLLYYKNDDRLEQLATNSIDG